MKKEMFIMFLFFIVCFNIAFVLAADSFYKCCSQEFDCLGTGDPGSTYTGDPSQGWNGWIPIYTGTACYVPLSQTCPEEGGWPGWPSMNFSASCPNMWVAFEGRVCRNYGDFNPGWRFSFPSEPEIGCYEHRCNNNLDDDRDGFIDLQDIDCLQECTPCKTDPALPYDNGRVAFRQKKILGSYKECVEDKDKDGFIPRGGYSSGNKEKDCLGDCNDDLEFSDSVCGNIVCCKSSLVADLFKWKYSGDCTNEWSIESDQSKCSSDFSEVCNSATYMGCSFCIHPRQNHVNTRKCGVDFSCETYIADENGNIIQRSDDEIANIQMLNGFQKIDNKWIWNGVDNGVYPNGNCSEDEQCINYGESVRFEEEYAADMLNKYKTCVFNPGQVAGDTACGINEFQRSQVQGFFASKFDKFSLDQYSCLPNNENADISGKRFGELNFDYFTASYDYNPCRNLALSTPSNFWKGTKCVKKDKCVDGVDNNKPKDLFSVSYLKNYLDRVKLTIPPVCCARQHTIHLTKGWVVNTPDEAYANFLNFKAQFDASHSSNNGWYSVNCDSINLNFVGKQKVNGVDKLKYNVRCDATEDSAISWTKTPEECYANKGIKPLANILSNNLLGFNQEFGPGFAVPESKCKEVFGENSRPQDKIIGTDSEVKIRLVDVDDPDCHDSSVYCNDADADGFCGSQKEWCYSNVNTGLDDNCNSYDKCIANFDYCLKNYAPEKKYQTSRLFPDCIDSANNFYYVSWKDLPYGDINNPYGYKTLGQMSASIFGHPAQPEDIHPFATLSKSGNSLDGNSLASACGLYSNFNCNKGMADETKGYSLAYLFEGKSPFSDDWMAGREIYSCGAKSDVDYQCYCLSYGDAYTKAFLGVLSEFTKKTLTFVILTPIFVTVASVPAVGQAAMAYGLSMLATDAGRTGYYTYRFFRAIGEGSANYPKQYFYSESSYISEGWSNAAAILSANYITGGALTKLVEKSFSQKICNNCPKISANCFLEGTKILLENEEYKNIEDIKEGDRVKAFDVENNISGDASVIETFVKNASSYRIIEYEVVEDEN